MEPFANTSEILEHPSASPRGTLGIIAGGGAAPRQLIEACLKLGRPFFVLCLEGQADPDLAEGQPHLWLSLGAGEALKKIVLERELREIVMVGRVRRPSLKELKPDWLALKILTKIGINALGDDGLLRGVGRAIEAETGARLVGAQDVFSGLLAPCGLLTKTAPTEADEKDILRGLELAKALGSLDVGQAVVVQQGLVLGLEAIEGTDALIARAGTLRRAGEGGVLVKCAKPQQDRRFDLPSIGPQTIEALSKAGLRGVAVEAGHSLLIEREKTLALADEKGIFVVGMTRQEEM